MHLRALNTCHGTGVLHHNPLPRQVTKHRAVYVALTRPNSVLTAWKKIFISFLYGRLSSCRGVMACFINTTLPFPSPSHSLPPLPSPPLLNAPAMSPSHDPLLPPISSFCKPNKNLVYSGCGFKWKSGRLLRRAAWCGWRLEGRRNLRLNFSLNLDAARQRGGAGPVPVTQWTDMGGWGWRWGGGGD